MAQPARPLPERAQRRDARANRERILAAAARAFADEGFDVSLIEIARRAGVGNATIHRHFTKEQLLAELFQDLEDQLGAALQDALDDPDPWRGFTDYLDLIFTGMERDRALAQLSTFRMRSDSVLVRKFAQLVKRARDAGGLRPDVTAQDVHFVLMGIGQALYISSGIAPGQWRRQLVIAVAGLRPDNQALPGRSLSVRQLEQAMDEQVANLL
jgi:AcrR family transcriptional regulator